MRRILVTGGAGYIGSHCCVQLLEQGYEVVCADNFSNSSPLVMQRVETITGKPVPTVALDMCNAQAVQEFFAEHSFDAAIHFAGYKAVGESIADPIAYYENNIIGFLNLCRGMERCGKNIVFSSSATVYGDAAPSPLHEDLPTGQVTNPYGRTKVIIEQILMDLCASDPTWNVSLLRYFNPVGAHESGLIGENPEGIPNNLMPFISQVAVGKLEELNIFGGDYDTPDGTCIRDFIHVCDLAEGHVSVLRKMEQSPGLIVHNLGTGKGYSVLELLRAFEQVNSVAVPHRIVERRPGDVPVCYADASKARTELGWEARRGIEDMVRDTWRWQTANPKGYAAAQED